MGHGNLAHGVAHAIATRQPARLADPEPYRRRTPAGGIALAIT